MSTKEKECMLYLPIYSELYSVKIGVKEGSRIEPLESPFRHRIGIFGSSFTHGISTTRAGMSYPMQLMRWTGLQFLSLACRKYDNVYFIQPDATDSMHETSADGTHPSDHGYTLWAQSIRKPMLKILKKYGIR